MREALKANTQRRIPQSQIGLGIHKLDAVNQLLIDIKQVIASAAPLILDVVQVVFP